MPKSVLIDTNILLDAAMSERPDHGYAIMLFDEAVYSGLAIYVSATSYKDVYYVLSKYASEPDSRSYIANLLKITKPIAVDAACMQIAITSNEPDFEDGIVRACAERQSVDAIISRDNGAFAHSAIPAYSAKEYVELFCDTVEVAF